LEENRREILTVVVKEWNGLVKNLIALNRHWNNYSKVCIDHRVNIEEFPEDCQKALAKANPKGDFDIILDDIINHGKFLEDFLKTQFIRLKEEEAKPQPSKGD